MVKYEMDVTDFCNGLKVGPEGELIKGDPVKVPLPVGNRVSALSENDFSSCNHRRAGSTGTTSTGTNESYTTTDDEADIDISSTIIHQLFNTESTTVNPNTIISPTNSYSSVYSDLETDLYPPDDHCNDMAGLRAELHKARDSIRRKDEELERLAKIRQDVASELEDLTASLFQEAHNMVRAANERQAAAEKTLRECELKVDLLSAEVSALKTLVLTSTPSMPNKHLHPQIANLQTSQKHRRCSSTSHFQLNYGRDGGEHSEPSGNNRTHSPTGKDKRYSVKTTNPPTAEDYPDLSDLDVDPVLYEEFLEWKKNISLDKEGTAFMRRVYREDVDLCLEFVNKELSAKVVHAIEKGIILIEGIGDKAKTMFPKKCALMEVQKQCHYRMNFGSNTNPDPSSTGSPATWHFISMFCRNRIIAVCDFLNYLKYIEMGLVKSTMSDIYWEIVKLRKDMMIARLGLVHNSLH